MSLAGIVKLNGLYSFAEQKGLLLEEDFEALKSQRVGSSHWALIRSWICGGLTLTASYILSSSRVQRKEKSPTSLKKRLLLFRDLLIGFTILIPFGLVTQSKMRTNHTRSTD